MGIICDVCQIYLGKVKDGNVELGENLFIHGIYELCRNCDSRYEEMILKEVRDKNNERQ